MDLANTAPRRKNLKVTRIAHPDVFGTVGETFTLVCNKSTDDPVEWWYRPDLDAGKTEYITVGAKLINGYKERCRLNGDDLIFEQLELNDTGYYICLEKAAYGVRHDTYLYVSGNLISALC